MLTLYRPHHPTRRTHRLLSDWMHAPLWEGAPELLQTRIPNVSFDETDEAYFLEAELPGMRDSDVNVEVDGGGVHIRAERKVDEEGDESTPTRRTYSSFRHSFRLPGRVDTEAIEGTMKEGLLRLTMPKRASEKVTVKGANEESEGAE